MANADCGMRNAEQTDRADALILEARSWIGTPFMHAARVKGIGVDCGGVIVASAQAVGLPIVDKANISPAHVDSAALVSHMLLFSDEIAIDGRQPGDVLLFRVHGNPRHLGLLVTNQTFVHAYQSAGKVCETELAPVWIRQLVAVYRLKEGLWQR